jgi:hypothetical protein
VTTSDKDIDAVMLDLTYIDVSDPWLTSSSRQQAS